MSYHFLCKRGIRPARTEQFLVLFFWLVKKFVEKKIGGREQGGSQCPHLFAVLFNYVLILIGVWERFG